MKRPGWIFLSFIFAYGHLSCENGQSTRDQDSPVESDSSIDSGSDSSNEPIYNNTGICGISGDGTVTPESFRGFEDTYLIGEEGDGDDICRVRFTVRNVGLPTVPCENCRWAFTVEKSEPTKLTDLETGCAQSELRLSDEKIAAEIGRRFSIGYAEEDTGHAHVLLRLNDITGIWEAVSVASWNEETGLFFYDRKDGFCGY